MKNKNNIVNFVFAFFSLIGFIFFSLGIVLFFTLSIDKEDRVYTTAIIERIDQYRDSDGDTSYDVFVSYIVDDKKYIEELNSYSSSYREGKEIEVYYDKNNPNKVRTNGFEFGFLIFSGLGLIFVVIGISGIVKGILKKKKEKELKQTGMIIEAEYVTTLVNRNFEVNGENPYNIICKFYNYNTNQFEEIKSDNLWFNPEPAIMQNNITKFKVYVNPNNLSEYFIDTSEIENNFKSN